MKFYTEPGHETYEDVQEFHAAKGWGCKCCGELSSPEWWQTSGDTYCKRCKKEMSAELGRLQWHRYPTREEAGKTRTIVWAEQANPPAKDGFDYAEWQRADYARMHAEYAAMQAKLSR